jgi:flagellar assembly factor FliW
MTIPPDTVVTFAAGLPGFERCRRYQLIQSEAYAPGVCLRGLDAPAPTFFTVDPRLIDAGFVGTLSGPDRARLGVTDATPCVWLAMVSWVEGEPVPNLRAPIVINPTTMRGIQIVPSDVEVAC